MVEANCRIDRSGCASALPGIESYTVYAAYSEVPHEGLEPGARAWHRWIAANGFGAEYQPCARHHPTRQRDSRPIDNNRWAFGTLRAKKHEPDRSFGARDRSWR